MNKSVYSIDFDGTLCELAYPLIGEPKPAVIAYIKQLKQDGHKIILNTCREGVLLENAVLWCTAQGIEFDAINENLPELIAQYGGDCRKISADYYLDDKNIKLEDIT